MEFKNRKINKVTTRTHVVFDIISSTSRHRNLFTQTLFGPMKMESTMVHCTLRNNSKIITININPEKIIQHVAC